jgi:hypothetical protein
MVYFDETYYLQSKLAQLKNIGESYHPDGDTWNATNLKAFMLEQGMTPQEHYLRYGRSEGLDPNPYFNEAEYLQAKTDQLNSVQELKPGANAFSTWTVADTLKAITDAGMLPVEHYERYGAFETYASGNFINPSNDLDTSAYWSAKLSQLHATEPNGNWTQAKMVAAFQNAGLSPVSHYMRYGEDEAQASGITFVQPVLVDVTVTQDDAPNDDNVLVTGNINGGGFAEVVLGVEGIVTVTNGTLVGAPALRFGGTLDASAVTGEGELRLSVGADFDPFRVVNDDGFIMIDGKLIDIVGSATVRNNVVIEGSFDFFTGGNNADSIEVFGDDNFILGLSSGPGHDSIRISGGGVCRISGGEGNDSITVSDGSVYGTGRRYDDRVNPIGIYGDDGADSITVSGGSLTAPISGGNGNDTISFTDGTISNRIYGDDGNDIITVSGGSLGSIDGGAGNDIITVSGGRLSGVLFSWDTGGITDILIRGGEGNDVITIGKDATIVDLSSTHTSPIPGSRICGDGGADIINLGGQSLTLRYASGDTGKCMPLAPGSGSTINTAQFDVIKGIGSSVTFYEEDQSWATAENLSALPTTNPSTDGGIYLVKGAYNESSNTFSAASGGESTLLIFDTDVSTATNFEAVVLVGVPVASTTNVVVDNSVNSFTVNFA